MTTHKELQQGYIVPEGWHGVILDGTFSEFIPEMIDLIKQWRVRGERVKIFTDQVYSTLIRKRIYDWCRKYLGEELEVTCEIDYGMIDYIIIKKELTDAT